MNIKCETYSNQPTKNLSRRQLNIWFTKQGGNELASTTKPLDTPEHIAKRNKCVREYFGLLIDIFAPFVYLDNKRFYTTNCRRKIKLLPKKVNEEVGSYFILFQKVRSHSFPQSYGHTGGW